MASVRSLKKDIDFLMSMVLQDCISVMENYPETDKEKVTEMARKVISDHRQLRLKVCHREIRNHKENPGKYLSDVVEEMYALAGDSLDQLAGFAKKESEQ